MRLTAILLALLLTGAAPKGKPPKPTCNGGYLLASTGFGVLTTNNGEKLLAC